MVKKILTILVLTLLVGTIHGENWQQDLTLWSSLREQSSKLTFGINDSASNGYDYGLDMVIPAAPPFSFYAYFPISDTLYPAVNKLEVDIRDSGHDTVNWIVKHDGDSISGTKKVTWEPDSLLSLEGTVEIGATYPEESPPDSFFNMREKCSLQVNSGEEVYINFYRFMADTHPPKVRSFSPTGREVPVYAPINFEITDDSGVDSASIQATLNDTFDFVPSSPHSEITEIDSGFRISFQDSSNIFWFARHESIRIQASDLSDSSNTLDTTIVFITDSVSPLTPLWVTERSDADTFTDTLKLGLSPWGSDGFDRGLDFEAPPPPPSAFVAAFTPPSDTTEMPNLRIDIKNFRSAQNCWIIQTFHTESGTEHFCEWDSTIFSAVDTLLQFKIGVGTSDTSTVDEWHSMASTNRITFTSSDKIFIVEEKYYEKISPGKHRSNGLNNFITCYPNPAITQTKIRYQLSEASNIKISLFNLNGKRVKKIYAGFQKKGNHEKSIYLNNLKPGLYLCSLKTETQQLTNKLLLLQ